MNAQYFRIDEYFTAEQESKKHLAYFVLANIVYKNPSVEGVINAMVSDKEAMKNDSAWKTLEETVESIVRGLSERLGYPFKTEPIFFIIKDMTEFKLDPFEEGLYEIDEYGRPEESLQYFIDIAKKDPSGLKDLITLFGYTHEDE